MTIEILETRTVSELGTALSRQVEIIVTSGANSYLYSRGGLPLTGNLQTVLEAEEAELFAKAQANGKAVDLYEITVKRVLKAFALVMLDEINILRVQAGLSARTAAQAQAALLVKLKGMS